jgi:hypothetical protein
VGPGYRHEAGGGRIEDELQQLALVASHLDAAAVVVHAHDDARLRAAAEVGDA